MTSNLSAHQPPTAAKLATHPLLPDYVQIYRRPKSTTTTTATTTTSNCVSDVPKLIALTNTTPSDLTLADRKLRRFYKCSKFNLRLGPASGQQCFATYNSDMAFARHCLNCHPKQLVHCIYCYPKANQDDNKILDKRLPDDLIDHMLAEHCGRQYQCNLCLYRAITADHVYVHQSLMHRDVYDYTVRNRRELNGKLCKVIECVPPVRVTATGKLATVSDAYQHYAAHRWERLNNSDPKHSRDYQCLYCDYMSPYGKQVVSHCCHEHPDRHILYYKASVATSTAPPERKTPKLLQEVNMFKTNSGPRVSRITTEKQLKQATGLANQAGGPRNVCRGVPNVRTATNASRTALAPKPANWRPNQAKPLSKRTENDSLLADRLEMDRRLQDRSDRETRGYVSEDNSSDDDMHAASRGGLGHSRDELFRKLEQQKTGSSANGPNYSNNSNNNNRLPLKQLSSTGQQRGVQSKLVHKPSNPRPLFKPKSTTTAGLRHPTGLTQRSLEMMKRMKSRTNSSAPMRPKSLSITSSRLASSSSKPLPKVLPMSRQNSTQQQQQQTKPSLKRPLLTMLDDNDYQEIYNINKQRKLSDAAAAAATTSYSSSSYSKTKPSTATSGGQTSSKQSLADQKHSKYFAKRKSRDTSDSDQSDVVVDDEDDEQEEEDRYKSRRQAANSTPVSKPPTQTSSEKKRLTTTIEKFIPESDNDDDIQEVPKASQLFVCLFCDSVSDSERSTMDHMMVHFDDITTCSDDYNVTRPIHKWSKHFVAKQMDLFRRRTTGDNDNYRYECPICVRIGRANRLRSKGYKEFWALKSHFYEHSMWTPVSCRLCRPETDLPNNDHLIANHMNSRHYSDILDTDNDYINELIGNKVKNGFSAEQRKALIRLEFVVYNRYELIDKHIEQCLQQIRNENEYNLAEEFGVSPSKVLVPRLPPINYDDDQMVGHVLNEFPTSVGSLNNWRHRQRERPNGQLIDTLVLTSDDDEEEETAEEEIVEDSNGSGDGPQKMNNNNNKSTKRKRIAFMDEVDDSDSDN
ncbi:uncharacterized protein LOC128961121 [Oppia nitens]|uniref:uncharacterized protein LOC128961121 n=1 Tax=Oppia nitens TaxID=1686743 RepID=UPI0023DC8C8D|nr:uncharacterized protein LOC128961121 [Oppia nitens]